MLNKIRGSIIKWLFKPELEKLADMMVDQENLINQRVAEIVSKMDPFEPLMKEFHGAFSEDYQRPEEQLNEPGKLQMYMFGHRWMQDPSFTYLCDWIMNQHGSMVFKAAHLNRDTALDIVLYAKAQISTMVLLRKELGRLSSLYQEVIQKNDNEAINSFNTVE